MIIFISPAKTFTQSHISSNQLPFFGAQTKELANHFSNLSKEQLKTSMKLSEKIANQTYQYYQNFNLNKQPALYSYHGHQYKHLGASSLNDDDLRYANDHLYIISGLYGLLKPLDLISFYRLEMNDKSFLNLYDFWTPLLLEFIMKHHENDILINLASDEYGQIIKNFKTAYTIEFFQLKDKKKSIHSMEVKKMRGLWTHYLLKNRVDHLSSLKKIEIEGYIFNPKLSLNQTLVFTKEMDV